MALFFFQEQQKGTASVLVQTLSAVPVMTFNSSLGECATPTGIVWGVGVQLFQICAFSSAVVRGWSLCEEGKLEVNGLRAWNECVRQRTMREAVVTPVWFSPPRVRLKLHQSGVGW